MPSKDYKSKLGIVEAKEKKVTKPIPKISEKKKERIKENGTETALFSRVWESRVHSCVVCGKNIIEAKPECFSHVLSKGRYPNLRYNEENIALVCGIDCHKRHDASNKGKDLEILKRLGVVK